MHMDHVFCRPAMEKSQLDIMLVHGFDQGLKSVIASKQRSKDILN